MRFIFYLVCVLVSVFSYESMQASYNSWQNGLQNCLDNDNGMPVTAEDVSLLQNNSWVYAAQFRINTSGIIIVQMRKVEDNKICKENCNKTCQACDTDFVFNGKNRSSLRSHQNIMDHGIHYIMKDSHFDDYPDPDECLEYEFAVRKLVARNCSDFRQVQCINGPREAYITTACYQVSGEESCLPNIERLMTTDSYGPQECRFPASCLEGSFCQIILIGGILFISIIFSIVCIKCCIKYQVRRILKNIRHEETTTDQKDPKIKIYTYNYTDEHHRPAHSTSV
ncbi:uncharacterized protein LOC125664565 isoform X1 [Ostrea edulis]|uniref:uncharacterized protein LOC125664565 isoform X1 n=1 Tax=Ostrea edulis TaxID=37623 RepID=UPI0024AFEF65|nr:uncharacterized protein LOC125664565 isoform X1 [Ostrea edulis]